ncbi:AI-2E family transporter [Bradyrhizobium ontarionense]|uniref:AI-2E family transporter n=1 Tax=Bradyrhizobium ontarionense TaxID=2898149 RepID=A0ABY3RJ20_9BRAD|nr:AI-2E family transporter [Bradyrhizobium sp. A19]UFZ06802.1 AI-2E family transporter [Bradyrhizobium sp. A19]
MRSFEDRVLLLLLVAISLTFGWILLPFYGAVLWGVIGAIVFAPLHRRLSRSIHERRGLAAVVVVLLVVLIVILPLSLIAASLAQEASGVYKQLQSGELDIGQYFQRMLDAFPTWVVDLLNRFGLGSLAGMKDKLSAGLLKGSQILAGQALNIGQGTFELFVDLFFMLYLLFFLLRDAETLSKRIRDAIPLRPEQLNALLLKFTVVIRATVKGSLLVALAQGALGGLIFWFLDIPASLLWAVVMAFLSLLPAVGAGLVWFPVALYLLATGSIWQGVVLIAYGALVIGLVDNVLRPILVGQDTKMPDYVVLISTLGGIEVFGLNGFVIGPVIAAMFIAIWDMFSAARREAAVAAETTGGADG